MRDSAELWEKIPGTKNLFVSDRGRILSMAFGVPTIVNGKRNAKGYLRFRVNGRVKFIHRIVAEIFLPPPTSEQTQINHINGNKSDNRVINLEWCTRSENQKHSYDILGRTGYWKGKTRSPLSEAQKKQQSATLRKTLAAHPEIIERIKAKKKGKYALGHNPRAIPTVCYETGEVFSCGREAAIKFGIPLACISQSIHKGSMVAGKYHFYQLKKNNTTQTEKTTND